MNKLNKVAMLFVAASTLAGCATQGASTTPTVGNWTNTDGQTWLDKGTDNLCWRNGQFSPESGVQGCDGVPVPPPPPPPPPPAPEPAPAPVAPVAAPVAPPAPVSEKVSFAADAFFDFNKSVLKAEGKSKLDDLASKITGLNLEAVIAVGHTDSVGSDKYNEKLSLKRAAAVKAYLVSKGVDAAKVYTEGKGEKQPVADNRTKDGRAKNRRVEIEVVGTRTK